MHVGTEAGEKQIPESLGLAPGLVFLICLIVFQQLQSYDFRAITERLHSSSNTQKQAWVSPVFHNQAKAGVFRQNDGTMLRSTIPSRPTGIESWMRDVRWHAA